MPVQRAAIRYALPSKFEIFSFYALMMLMLALGWPFLFSAPDTISVVCGILTIVLMVLWAWSIFKRKALFFIEEK